MWSLPTRFTYAANQIQQIEKKEKKGFSSYHPETQTYELPLCKTQTN
jgi:hypothetical protein